MKEHIEIIGPDKDVVRLVEKIIDQNGEILKQTAPILITNLPAEALAALPVVAEIVKQNSQIIQAFMTPPMFIHPEGK